MLQIVHDGVAHENHLGLQLSLVVALLGALPVARFHDPTRAAVHVKQFCQLVIVNRHAETNHRHQQVAHVLSVGHLNDSRFHGIALLLNVLALKISSQCSNVNGAEFSIGRYQYRTRLIHNHGDTSRKIL